MKNWYLPGHFLPREIERDPAWQKLSEGGKKTYRFLCEHSYLTSNSPTRRYSYWSYAQIGERVGLSRPHVKRIVKELMRTRLLLRWYRGDSEGNPDTGGPRVPRYEIPASRGMVIHWRWYFRQTRRRRSRL
jgi:AraC-like DNA-binding protein